MEKVIFSKDSFGRKFIDKNINSITRIHFGFIDTECTFVENLLTGIVYNTLDSASILDETRINSLNNLLNKLVWSS